MRWFCLFLCLVVALLITKQFMFDTAVMSPGLFQGVVSGRWAVGL